MSAEAITRLRATARELGGAFETSAGAGAEAYREELRLGLREGLAQLRADLREHSGGHLVCEVLGEELSAYVDWLQWTLWDLPWLAVALASEPARFRTKVTRCAFVYISLRLVDDIVDHHYNYRGRQPTLLSRLSARFGDSRSSEGLALLGALLLCFEGLHRLAEEPSAAPVREILATLRRVVIGASMELQSHGAWDRASYERLIQLKNVDYWKISFAALDPEHDTALAPVLERHYALAQKLNDLQDLDQDLVRGQPNIACLHLDPEHVGDVGGRSYPASLIRELEHDLLAVGALIPSLPPAQRGVAYLLLHRHFEDCAALGIHLGQPPQAVPKPPSSTAASLDFTANLNQVLACYGPTAIEHIDCPICEASTSTTLFHAQGFRIARCERCHHCYVNPRLRAPLVQELAGLEDELDPFLSVQKLYAAELVDELRSRCEGERLLDIGPGRGYFVEQARAHGLQVYAFEGASELINHLRPSVGARLEHGLLDDGALPWKSFDIVVLSHVLEHIPDPLAALRRIYGAMRPRAWLYVAVPDIESMQFRVLGRRWDAISPIAHLHYFSARSLTRALEHVGLCSVERLTPPLFPAALTDQWMHLFRKLGGDDVGELRMLAQRPPLSAELGPG
ncbi:MAG: class I SAM-dependent methyltransferase [Enhygromyxa sp.]